MALEHWAFDLSHSTIGFTVRHLVVTKVHGRFPRWKGDLYVDPQDPSSFRLDVAVEVASVDTHEAKRDEHLRSADFFDAEKYPSITFKSTKLEAAGDNEYRVRGDLTIHGVTRPVELQVEYSGQVKDPWGGERLGATAKTTINRKDFGMVFNAVAEAGQLVVGDKIEITLDVEAVKQVPVKV